MIFDRLISDLLTVVAKLHENKRDSIWLSIDGILKSSGNLHIIIMLYQ